MLSTFWSRVYKVPKLAKNININSSIAVPLLRKQTGKNCLHSSVRMFLVTTGWRPSPLEGDFLSHQETRCIIPPRDSLYLCKCFP